MVTLGGLDSAETIAAIGTPAGEGAIALLRLSGPEAIAIAGQIFRGRTRVEDMAARRQYFGAVMEGERKIDDVLLTVFPAPASYTGEPVVEISCHGGMLVTRRLLDLLLSKGARMAAPGEFTQRAFLNGKLDLTQAEAVMDLISAQSDLALQAAQEQLAGSLGRHIRVQEDQLLDLLAHVEAYIDFPDEDIAPETEAELLKRIASLIGALDALLATAGRGRILREGVRTVIYGAPNVGKSSLLNLLLGYDRALVSPTPGTTRDSVEEVINIQGYPLRLVDTAGIRESADAVEQAGMERTHRELERAGLILHVHDATQERVKDSTLNRAGELLLLNKIDLPEHPSWSGVEAIRISCHSGEGVDQLEREIEAKLSSGAGVQQDWSVAVNARHQEHLLQARRSLEAAREALTGNVSAEFVAEELRAALAALGEIVGRLGTEDLLGRIFSTFCIGK